MRSLVKGNAEWVEAPESNSWGWVKEVAERREEKGEIGEILPNKNKKGLVTS